MNATRVLVTGSSGFVGGELAKALRAAGHEVVGVDPRPGPQTTRRGRASAECAGESYEVIFHLGGTIDVATCEKDPIAAWEGNVAESVALARGTKAERAFVFTSTVAALKPGFNAYGQTKAQALWCLTRMGLPLAVAVLPNVYGLQGSGVVTRLMFEREPVIYGTGEQMREFAYIEDVVRLLADVGLGAKTGVHPMSGERTSINRVARLMGRQKEVRHAPARTFELEDSPSATVERRHQVSLKDGIKKMVKEADALGMTHYAKPEANGR